MKTPNQSLRNHARTIALAALLCALAATQSIYADTILVTSTADDGSPGTLRAALAPANNGDVIDATGVSGTILLLPDPNFFNASQLNVNSSVTLRGPGAANLTIDGNQTGRVFYIAPGLTVEIEGIGITNGHREGDFGTDRGAGIFNDHASLTVRECTISGNTAVGSGGGILNLGSGSGSASLAVVKSTINNNSAGEFGGGITNFASGSGIATLDVESSTISGNTAESAGGVHNFVDIQTSADTASATAAIIASTLSGNSAQFEGGAIVNDRGALILSSSTISSNSSVDRYAGLYNNRGGLAKVSSCTFSGNSVSEATLSGGAITTGSGSTTEIANTILRAGAIGVNIRRVATSAQVISHGFNLCSDEGESDLTATGDRINTDPVLGPLADNGGPTLTHLPLLGSFAIDQGTSDGLAQLGITTDQRGLARTVDDPVIANVALGDGTDIGAVEIAAAPPPPPPDPIADVAISFLGADKTSVKQGEVLTYTIAIRNFGPNTATNVVVNDLMSSGTGFLSARATKGNFAAPPVNESGAVVWMLGDMANGTAEGAELVVSVLVKGKTTVTNLATVQSDADDPNAENNVAAITTSVATGGGKKK
jgi:uncharacterized repeat protein (TIGR01451 family)